MCDLKAFRAEFLRFLTEDLSGKDFTSQAIFDLAEGWVVWSSTDLEMVMEKFDLAAEYGKAGSQS